MNNGQFETQYIDDPEWSYQIRVYNKLLGQQTITRYPQGWWVRSELVLRQDLPESFVRSVQQVEDDDAFCRVLSIGLMVTKMRY